MSPNVRTPLSLEYILLGLVFERPMYGYEIHQLLSRPAGLGLIWNLKQSQLYALLDKLEKEGLLEARLEYQESRPPRKVFTLTRSGTETFLKWVHEPVLDARAIRQEFLAKLYFYQNGSIYPPGDLLQRQRAACEAWLESLVRQADLAGETSPYDELVFAYRIHQVQAILGWLDECEKSIPLNDGFQSTSREESK